MNDFHLFVVHAASGEEACRLAAESIGEDIGNRLISGAVSENGIVYSTGEGEFDPARIEGDPVKVLNSHAELWTGRCRPEYEIGKRFFLVHCAGDRLYDADWEKVAQYVEEMRQLNGAWVNARVKADVFEMSFYDGCYEGRGITQNRAMYRRDMPPKWAVVLSDKPSPYSSKRDFSKENNQKAEIIRLERRKPECGKRTSSINT